MLLIISPFTGSAVSGRVLRKDRQFCCLFSSRLSPLVSYYTMLRPLTLSLLISHLSFSLLGGSKIVAGLKDLFSGRFHTFLLATLSMNPTIPSWIARVGGYMITQVDGEACGGWSSFSKRVLPPSLWCSIGGGQIPRWGNLSWTESEGGACAFFRFLFACLWQE